MAIKFYLNKDSKDNLYLENYPTEYTTQNAIEIENDVFDANLSLDRYYRGRSASGLIFFVKGHPSGYGFFAHMPISGIGQLFHKYEINNGNVSGKFKFKKQGANVFIMPAED